MTQRVSMKLPPIHNERAKRQWKIINKYANFKDKSVIDLGCGYADILMRCYKAGAQLCCGVEKDVTIATEASLRVDSLSKVIGQDIFIIQSNIEWAENWPMDYAICFSVLPYLDNPILTLQWIRYHSKVVFIECQYKGDGPGFGWIEGDDDMESWLKLVGFRNVKAIGKTLIRHKKKYRTIWMAK